MRQTLEFVKTHKSVFRCIIITIAGKTPLQYWLLDSFLLYTYTHKMEKLHVPQSRWWDWAAVALHFVLLQTVASRLVATSWTPFLYLTQTFT